VAPPSRQNYRQSCARTRLAKISQCAYLGLSGGSNPDRGFYHGGVRLEDGVGAVNVKANAGLDEQ
jgi:hypothetical protein